MQKEAIWKSKRIMPNRWHKCCKNYTYEGFVNKTNKNKEKDVSKVEQIKEEKKIMHRHASSIILLSLKSGLIIIIIIKIGGIRISLSTSAATTWWSRKVFTRIVHHHRVHVPVDTEICIG
jgi:hypothetical protein